MVWGMYVAAGIVMPLFYVAQIAACLRDRTDLAAYSLSKCAIHVALRFVMVPFIVVTGTPTMVVIVSLDLLGRCLEMAAAWFSLYRSGWSAKRIFVRVARLDFRISTVAQGASAAIPSADESERGSHGASSSLETSTGIPTTYTGAGLAPLSAPYLHDDASGS